VLYGKTYFILLLELFIFVFIFMETEMKKVEIYQQVQKTTQNRINKVYMQLSVDEELRQRLDNLDTH